MAQKESSAMEGYEQLLRFTEMMSGDWGWIPVAVATGITAVIFDFWEKIRSGH